MGFAAVDTSYPSWTNSNALSLGRFNKEWHQTGERPPADVSASPYQTPLQPDLTAHVPDSFRAPSAVPKTILALDHDDMLKDELGDNHRDMLNAVAQLGFEKGDRYPFIRDLARQVLRAHAESNAGKAAPATLPKICLTIDEFRHISFHSKEIKVPFYFTSPANGEPHMIADLLKNLRGLSPALARKLARYDARAAAGFDVRVPLLLNHRMYMRTLQNAQRAAGENVRLSLRALRFATGNANQLSAGNANRISQTQPGNSVPTDGAQRFMQSAETAERAQPSAFVAPRAARPRSFTDRLEAMLFVEFMRQYNRKIAPEVPLSTSSGRPRSAGAGKLRDNPQTLRLMTMLNAELAKSHHFRETHGVSAPRPAPRIPQAKMPYPAASVTLVPGAKEFLEWARDTKALVLVVTNRSHAFAGKEYDVLQRTGQLPGDIHAISGRPIYTENGEIDEGRWVKPNPLRLETLLQSVPEDSGHRDGLLLLGGDSLGDVLQGAHVTAHRGPKVGLIVNPAFAHLAHDAEEAARVTGIPPEIPTIYIPSLEHFHPKLIDEALAKYAKNQGPVLA